jgi:rhodanese-related sulfurtransferase
MVGLPMLMITASLASGAALPPGAVTASPPTESKSDNVPWGSYCGIYSLYAAMKLQGAEVQLKALVDPKYCGSIAGSTLAELAEATKASGFHATAFDNASPSYLRRVKRPAILHVKKDWDSESYDHYVLFIRADGDQARVFDPPAAVYSMPFRDLAARWDGTGLVISRELVPTSLGTSFAQPGTPWLATVAAVALAAAAVRYFSTPTGCDDRRLELHKRPKGQAVRHLAALAVGAAVMGFAYHTFADVGLLIRSSGATAIQREHFVSGIREMGHEAVAAAVGARDAVLVDARLEADYQAGHVAGAINIPVTMRREDRLRAMSDVPHDRRVIVYCQSRACPYADKIASRLTRDGYSSVFVYRAGWVDWHPPQQAGGDN